MRFNIRSALSAVGSLAEGTLAGQIEAQQEQERRDAQEYQRQVQLYQIGAGQQSDLLHARLAQEPNIAEGERLGFGSSVIDAQIKNPYADAPTWLGTHVSERARNRYNLPLPNGQQPGSATDVTGFPASGGENGPGPGLTPGTRTTQPVETGQPWATPANTPAPAPAPAPQPQPQAPPSIGPPTPPLGQMLGGSQFGAQATQMLSTVAPLMPFNMGSLLTQATNPPPARTSPVGVPPPAQTAPGDVGGAAAPQQQPTDLKGVVQPAQPMPQPAEQTPVTFSGVAGTYHGVGANVQALRVAFNDMTSLNKEIDKIDWPAFKEKDPVGYAKAVDLYQHEPSYESARTPEGYQAVIDHNDQVRGLLLTAPRKETAAGAASKERAQTADVVARRNALKNAFEKEISPTAPLSVIRQTIANYHLEDDYKNIDDLRGRVFGKRIDEEITKIQHDLENVSHMPKGALADLIGRLNGLKGYRPGSFKIPYSEYVKLSDQDRARLRAQTDASVDLHLARQDTHQLAPLTRERARLGIQETKARINDLEQKVRQRGDRAGLSAAADLRAYSHQEDRAATELQQYVRNPDHAGVEEDTMDFIDARFGPWLHANNPTLPPSSWEKELKSGQDQTEAGQKMAARPNIYIGYVRGVLKLHSLEVMRSAKQDELTRKFGGVPDEPSAASGGGWPAGWNSAEAEKTLAAMVGFGWNKDAARQEIMRHASLFGGR